MDFFFISGGEQTAEGGRFSTRVGKIQFKN
jgi:hypothetical protein